MKPTLFVGPILSAGILSVLTWAGPGAGAVRASEPPLLVPPTAAPSVPATEPEPVRPNPPDSRSVFRKIPPPSATPVDRPGTAPGPDYFYVSGLYVPSGDDVSWRPGFWSKAQPGWEWVPARWVQRSGGWSYREGHWERDAEEAAPNSPVFAPGPGGPADRGTDLGPGTDLAPLPDSSTTLAPNPANDPIAGAEADRGRQLTRVPAPGTTVIPDPRLVPPYYPGTVPLPVTDLRLPGVNIRVVPGQMPWVSVGNPPFPCPPRPTW